MKKLILPFLILLLPVVLIAQTPVINGVVTDRETHLPLAGVTVAFLPGKRTVLTNEAGRFSHKTDHAFTAISFSTIGYEGRHLPIGQFKNGQTVQLNTRHTQLKDVIISADASNPYKAITEMDIKMRGVANSQEVLRMVPGLFIGQHQGGGKAEQIFLRGFDNDHGTDVSLNVDGMPINLVSHAHGQGYADTHFIIPELIEGTTFNKGPYHAAKGNLATGGAVDFHTANTITQNLFKTEVGQYGTFRVLGMLNLLGAEAIEKQQSWYAASEYNYTDSYFDHSQRFNRYNFFTKYHGKLSPNNTLSLTASTLYSSWLASGQIPENAVEEGLIGFYGAIDPNEGGVTSRTNFNAQLLSTLNKGGLLKNQFYYSRYHLDLISNFTFFLNDPVNGDQIRQREGRNLLGTNSSYVQENYLGKTKITTQFGISTQFNATQNSELSHTKDHYTLLDSIKLGDIRELHVGAYLSETFKFNEQFSLNAGLRFDQFYYQYQNKFDGDTTLQGRGTYKANNNTVSPKLNFYYQPGVNTQFYLSMGKGFHSNDTRGVVAVNGLQTLPAAYGIDVGTVFKPFDNLLINLALWSMYLQNEYVYGGDGGSVEFSGKTRRFGVDFSSRYSPLPALFFDVDVNYARARATEEPIGMDYIPLAPVFTSTGGITYHQKRGFNGSLRYRYLSDRPGNEDYSLTAQGYFVNDLVFNYTKRRYEIGLTVNNIFNVKWKETQFETETRLLHEPVPVNGIAFTPGTKMAAKLSLTYFFK
mgnify:CR=1 FL=1